MIASMLFVDPEAQCDERFGTCTGADPNSFPGGWWGLAVVLVVVVAAGLIGWHYELSSSDIAALIAMPFFIGLGIYLLVTLL